MIDLNELSKECKKISDMRQANGGVGNDPLKHAAGEIIEAVEARDIAASIDLDSLDTKTKQKYYNARQLDYADELADVIICALVAGAKENFDMEGAILRNVDKNRRRALCIGDKL